MPNKTATVPHNNSLHLVNYIQENVAAIVNADISASAAIAQAKIAGEMVHGSSKHTSDLILKTSGSYVGNNTSNRAISHGLGKLPKLIILTSTEDTYATKCIAFGAMSLFCIGGTGNGTDVDGTSVPTDTNFYVGWNTSFETNLDAKNYSWVAYDFD